MSDPLLRVEDLEVRYGSALVLSGFNFSIDKGEVAAVLGPNGSGKSTMARAFAGLVRSTHGRIVFKGEDITRLSAVAIRRRGLVYIPETRAVFRELSVYDNLRLSAWLEGSRVSRKQAIETAFEMFPILGRRKTQLAGTLSGGEQQMLSLARILAVDSDLAIADELTLGLAPLMIDQVFSALTVARDAGRTIIVIEQFVDRALGLANTCTILTKGQPTWSGMASEAGSVVGERYLGGTTE